MYNKAKKIYKKGEKMVYDTKDKMNYSVNQLNTKSNINKLKKKVNKISR